MAHISARVQVSKKLTDINIVAEDFFKELFNRLYGYKIENANVKNKNAKSIDLIYEKKQLAYQITSQNDTTKIKKTVTGFIEDKRYDSIKRLIILSITTDKKCSSNNLQALDEHHVVSEYINLSDLENEITSKLETEDLEKVADFLDYSINPSFILEKSTNEDLSTLYENLHIVDQMHSVLKEFNGLKCIHPRTLAKLFPFTIGSSNYDAYSHYCLRTDNEKIHSLLSDITIENREIVQIKEELLPYKEKLLEIFSILNYSLVNCISFGKSRSETTHNKIWITEIDENCQCNQCKYTGFEIESLTDELKTKTIKHSENGEDALSEAYYLFKLGEPVESWKIFNSIQKYDNTILKFLAELNIKHLYSSINVYWHKNESKEILPSIKEIDIVQTIATNQLSRSVKDELDRINKHEHLHYSRRRIEELNIKIKNIKTTFEKGHGTFMGPSYISQLREELRILFVFYTSNNILLDDFVTFRNTIRKGITGILDSYSTSNSFKDRIEKIDNLLLLLIVEYIQHKEFLKLLKERNITELIINDKAKEKFIKRALSFFDFQTRNGFFGGVESSDILSKQEVFSRFRQSIGGIFNKIISILKIGNFSKEELSSFNQPVINFIKTNDGFDRKNWQYLTSFLTRHIELFSQEEIIELLELTINGKRHRSGEDELEHICILANEKNNFVINDANKLDKLISIITQPCRSCNSRHDEYSLLHYWHVANSDGKFKIESLMLNKLKEEFNSRLFESMAFMGIIKTEEHNSLIEKFIEKTIKRSRKNEVEKINEKWIYNDFSTINSLSCLSEIGLKLSDIRLKPIGENDKFYNWVLDPKEFNYEDFDLNWITDLCNLSFLRENLSESKEISTRVKEELKNNYNDRLAKYYIKYMS